MERVSYEMLFRWFIGLSMSAPMWDATVVTKSRGRLRASDIARALLAAVLADPKIKPLPSGEHCSVDGTLIEAWASMKRLRAKDGSGRPVAPAAIVGVPSMVDGTCQRL
jgi:transposase